MDFLIHKTCDVTQHEFSLIILFSGHLHTVSCLLLVLYTKYIYHEHLTDVTYKLFAAITWYGRGCIYSITSHPTGWLTALTHLLQVCIGQRTTGLRHGVSTQAAALPSAAAAAQESFTAATTASSLGETCPSCSGLCALLTGVQGGSVTCLHGTDSDFAKWLVNLAQNILIK